MTQTVTLLTGILVLAALVESLVEYLVRPLVKPWLEVRPAPCPEHGGGPAGADPRCPGHPQAAAESGSVPWADLLLRYTAAALALVLCILYRADLLTLLGLASPYPWVGYVVTGLLIGRGANFVHDFASRWI